MNLAKNRSKISAVHLSKYSLAMSKLRTSTKTKIVFDEILFSVDFPERTTELRIRIEVAAVEAEGDARSDFPFVRAAIS